jgi:hypothetical protein
MATPGCIRATLARVIDHPDPPATVPGPSPREPAQRWRLVLARGRLEPDLAGRSQQAVWESALAASGLPVAGLDGPRGRPRFAAAAPLGATIPGEAELLDIWLTERLPRWRVREALEAALPPDHLLVDVYDVWLGEAALPGRVSASVYRAVIEAVVDAAALRLAAAALLDEPALPRERRKGETIVIYDLRPFLEAIEVDEAVVAPAGNAMITIRMTLRHDPERGVGRPDELLAALSERTGVAFHARSIARERLILSTPAASAEPAARAHGPRLRPGRAGAGSARPGPSTGQARSATPPPRR